MLRGLDDIGPGRVAFGVDRVLLLRGVFALLLGEFLTLLSGVVLG